MGSGPERAAAASGAKGREPASGATPAIRRCIDCQHYRMRPKQQLFSSAELQSPGGLKAQTEWQEQEKQHAQREAQRFATGGAFTYEPHHYAWCASYTNLELVARANAGDPAALNDLMQTGDAVMNPVTGEVSPVYALCLRMNPNGDCERYERR